MQYKVRKLRTKAKVKKTNRYVVVLSKSNKNIFVQVRDPLTNKTKIGFSTVSISENLSKKEKASKAGEIVAGLLKKEKIDEITFDRNGYLYHGRIMAFAESLKNSGINI